MNSYPEYTDHFAGSKISAADNKQMVSLKTAVLNIAKCLILLPAKNYKASGITQKFPAFLKPLPEMK